MRYIYLLLFLTLSGCYSTISQYSYYKPQANETWKVDVEKVDGFKTKFVCRIDGDLVVEGSFPSLEQQFLVDSMYQDKPVQMSGFKKYIDTGKPWNESLYQIRVFIDHDEVTVFTF